MIVKKYKNGFDVEVVSYYPLLAQWTENSEAETQNWIIDHVLPNWVCFDLGAHVGYYSILLSSLTLYGQVFAFEPCEATRKMFAANLAHNKGRFGCDLLNIHLVPTAVGDRTGLNIPETLWFTNGAADYGKTAGEFDFTTLDSFCIDHNMVNRLDFIKCDVGGWDYEMLLGAEKVLEKFRPYVIIEINYALAWRGHTNLEVEAILNRAGYCHKVIDPCPRHWLCWPEEKV